MCFFFNSCYIESGYDISKKLEAKETDLDGKYVINGLGFITNEGKPSIDLFQKRGSSELKEVCFYLHKKYQPKEKDVDVEIINSVYKVKDNDNILKFTEVKKSIVNLYYIMKNNELQKYYISYEDKKLGYAGGFGIYLYFPEPIKARSLEYIEFDIIITDEDGKIYNHHLHYDIKTRPVFKMGSTLWEYWMSI